MSPILNAHAVFKRRTSLHKVIWSSAFRSGGDMLYICPNTNAKKRFSDNQFTNSDTIKHVGKQPYTWLFDKIGFPISGGHKSDFSLTEG